MQTGFETIGNAILALYNGGRPVLVTDPWFTPQAYFGSWGQSHEIPPQQLSGILGKRAEGICRKYVSDESLLHKAAKGLCWRYKKKMC